MKNSKGGDKKFIQEADFLKSIKAHLEAGKPVRSMALSEEERQQVKGLFLLTDKPVIYVANIAEDDLGKELPAVEKLRVQAAAEGAGALTICARTEEEIAQLPPEEKQEFLDALGIGESGLDQLVKECYSLLGLISYLTAGPKEVRAWTIEKGTRAPQAAGKIHTDFEKGFIRAEIVPYDTLVELGSMAACKEKGLVRSEGKDYVMQDGDVVLFRSALPPGTPCGGLPAPHTPWPAFKKAGENWLESFLGFPTAYAGPPLTGSGGLVLLVGFRGEKRLANGSLGRRKIPAFPGGRRAREARTKHGRGPKAPAPVCRETRLCVRHTPGLGHVAAKGEEYRESQGSPGTATWPVF